MVEEWKRTFLLQLEDDKQPIPFQATPFEETHAMFSPDGEWLAYVSDETGRSEVYVRALNGTEKHQISSEGGTEHEPVADGDRGMEKNFSIATATG